MKPIKERKPKKHYYIILDGRAVGESWAVSPEKARANYWGKNVKYGDEYSPRDYEPDDFDVIEA